MAVRLDRQGLAPAIVLCGFGLAAVLIRLARWVQLVDDAHVDVDVDEPVGGPT